MNPQQQRNPQQPPQVVIVQQQAKSHNGCLVTALMFVLFGWIGLAAMGVWKLTKLTWNLFIGWPVKWAWQATSALWRWSLQGSRALTARYGWRGWAVVGGVVVALAILGSIVGAGH